MFFLCFVIEKVFMLLFLSINDDLVWGGSDFVHEDKPNRTIWP